MAGLIFLHKNLKKIGCDKSHASEMRKIIFGAPNTG